MNKEKNIQKNNSTDLSQNVHEEKKNDETRKSFQDSSATDRSINYEEVKEVKEERDEGKDFGGFIRKEDHEDTKENHVGRLRQAMKMIEEEIKHIERVKTSSS